MRRAKARGYLTRAEFEAACRWKSPRAIRRVRSNSPSSVRAATRRALAARSERTRLEELTALRGVSVATASAILTMLDPRRYGVLDIRVWQLLHAMGAVTKNRAGVGFTAENWTEFLAVVRQLARRFGVTARAIELALFRTHVEYQEGRLYTQPR
jgi:8-oxoguanine DNA glycosylase-like protein